MCATRSGRGRSKNAFSVSLSACPPMAAKAIMAASAYFLSATRKPTAAMRHQRQHGEAAERGDVAHRLLEATRADRIGCIARRAQREQQRLVEIAPAHDAVERDESERERSEAEQRAGQAHFAPGEGEPVRGDESGLPRIRS